MATVNFLYRSTKSNAPLDLRLLFRIPDLPSKVMDRKTKEQIEVPYTDVVLGAKTQYKVSKDFWKNRNKKGDIDRVNENLKVNTDLNKIENFVLDAFNKVDEKLISKNWLNQQMELYYNPPKKNPEIPTNLVEYIKFYIDYRENEITPETVVKYNVIKHKLERMEEKRKAPILIKDINEDFKNEFVKYQNSKHYAQNTIQRELTFIKTFCKHARYLGLETHPQMDTLKIKKEIPEKIYLNFDELEAIEKQVFDNDYLDNARDFLIISAYLGQRVSDLLRFNKEMIRVENGKSFLEFTQKKTGKFMTVPMHEKVLKILEKRNGEFPRSISDQRYNEYIKEVCRLSGINELVKGGKQMKTKNGMRKVSGMYPKWELVTSHIGRRSFASNFYGKIPTSYLIYITGHSSEVLFRQYLSKNDKDLAMEISKYF